MPTRQEAQALARGLHGLSKDPEILRKAAARALADLHPFDVNELVHHLILLARDGWEPAGCVLPAFVSALGLESDLIPHASALKRLSVVQSLKLVEALFPEGPAPKRLDPGAAAKADAQAFSESLGHLKLKARATRDPDELARLVMVSNPVVVKNALLNPRLTEEWVVRMAARRPVRPEPLIEIWKSQRWSNRPAVRRALAFNPYLPPEVGAKIVPLLTQADLKELARDASLHPSLREQATLLMRRP